MNRTLKILVILLASILFAIVIKERYVQRLFKASSKNKNSDDSKVWNTVYWIQRKAYLDRFDCSGKIIFLGTSLVAETDWNELLNRTDICNRGIGGDITAGILRRIDSYIKQNPRAIFLEAGTNDFFWNLPMDSVKQHYTEIIQKIRSASVPLYIMLTNFTSDKFSGDYNHINTQVAALNGFLTKYCLQNNISFINTNSGILKEEKLDNAFTYDGIHLNGTGYIRVADALRPYLVQY